MPVKPDDNDTTGWAQALQGSRRKVMHPADSRRHLGMSPERAK